MDIWIIDIISIKIRKNWMVDIDGYWVLEMIFFFGLEIIVDKLSSEGNKNHLRIILGKWRASAW